MATLDRGFIFPSINDPYVYLKTLKTDNNYMANITGEAASNVLNSIDENLKYERINSSLEFLNQVAQAQRNHELAFIQERIKLLYDITNGEGKEIQDILDKLQRITDPEQFDYLEFIKALNSAVQGLARYKQRIDGMIADSAPRTEDNSHYNVEALRNIVKDSNAIIGNFIGKRSKFYYSQEELIRQLTIRFFKTEIAQNFLSKQVGKQGAINFAAAAKIIENQLTHYLLDTGLLNYQKTIYKDETEFLEQLEALSKKLEEFSKQYKVENILSNNSLLKDAAKMYGIKVVKKSAQTNNDPTPLKVQKKLDSLREKIGDPLATQEQTFKNNLRDVEVTWTDLFKVGISEELTTLIASHMSGKHTGKLNTGTDVLLGQIITKTPNLGKDPISGSINNIYTTLDTKKGAKKAKNISKLYLEQMEKLEKALKKIGKGFIIHESTKFYQSVEMGKWPWEDGRRGFKGREMTLLNYIDAIAEFGGSFGIDVKWLKFAAYNLPEAALGNELKNPLQTYFAIAAGLIMFDDFSVMAKEITEGLQFNNIQAIHLYNLNGVYMPASYFLQQTYYTMSQVKNEMADGNGFETVITSPEVSYSRSIDSSMAKRWEKVKKQARPSHITMYFGANFLELTSKFLS